MGPNVKFVSAITDAFFKKKMGVNFFLEKRSNPVGGSEGGLVKDHTFPPFFYTFPKVFMHRVGASYITKHITRKIDIWDKIASHKSFCCPTDNVDYQSVY